MADNKTSREDEIKQLNQQLEVVKNLQPKATAPSRVTGDAARIAIDFASATAVGTLIGFGFDRWQDTLPWGMLVGLLLGTCAGVKLMLTVESRTRLTPKAHNENIEQ